jgi:L-asparaginase
VGEDIVSGGLSVKIVTRVTDGMSLEAAAKRSFEELKSIDGFAGIIGISAAGEIYHCDSHPYMVWASFDVNLQVFN